MHYQVINKIIADLDPELSAAEIHGMATGMISVNNLTNTASWLQEVLQNVDAIEPNDKAALENFFEHTVGELVNEDFAFALVLPDDDSPLHERLDALRFWSRGYLFGLSYGTAELQWSEEILEVVKDISELTKLDSDAEGEEAEKDFTEITEYVKAGVIFVNTELNPINTINNNTVH